MSQASTREPSSADAADRLDALYDHWLEDDGARHCGALPDDACREVPGNFFLYVSSLVLTKLGDALINPKTTLTWIMSAVGAPGALVVLLVPIRESGSMLPQVVLGGWVRQIAVRKWIWVAGSLLQALSVAGLGAAAAFTTGTTAGVAMLSCVVLFSLSRSLASIASKDVKGKVIPKGRRGRASGLAANATSTLTLAAALALLASRQEDVPAVVYGWVLWGAALLWVLAAGLFSRISEHEGETEGGAGLAEALERLRLLAEEPEFRRFVVSRALFVSTALAGPYYVLLAREHADGGLSILAMFVLAGGIATTLSSILWGTWADRSSRRTMLAGATLASVLGVVAFVVAQWLPTSLQAPWLWVLGFFVLGIAHGGVRQGRKTHVVDMAEGNLRTDYVATSNTVIGALLLLSGALAPLVEVVGPAGMLLLLALFGFAGVGVGWGLREVQQTEGAD